MISCCKPGGICFGPYMGIITDWAPVFWATIGTIMFISPDSPTARIRSAGGKLLGKYWEKSSIKGGVSSGYSSIPTMLLAIPCSARLFTTRPPYLPELKI